MNKLIKIIACIFITVMITFSLSGCVQPKSEEANLNVTATNVSAEEAKKIALNHVNINSADCEFITATFDADDNDNNYEVKFKVSNVYYEYDVNADTGKIDSYTIDERAQSSQTSSSLTSSQGDTVKITADEAKQLAYKDAKLTDCQVTSVEVKNAHDNDNGVDYYEIDFISGTQKYHYEINKLAGEIIKKSQEKYTSNNTPPSSDGSKPPMSSMRTSSSDSSSTTITLEKAKLIAVEHSKAVTSTVKYTKSSIDKDDNIPQYDIEFTSGNFKFDYEINANTGELLSYSFDTINYKSTSSQSARITIDKAKEFAVSHCGLKVSDVTFTKSELDIKNGIDTYEIEFNTKTAEYEYDVDAFNGTVIDYSYELNTHR